MSTSCMFYWLALSQRIFPVYIYIIMFTISYIIEYYLPFTCSSSPFWQDPPRNHHSRQWGNPSVACDNIFAAPVKQVYLPNSLDSKGSEVTNLVDVLSHYVTDLWNIASKNVWVYISFDIMLMFTGFEFALSFTPMICPGHRHYGARSGDVASDPQCGRGRCCLAFFLRLVNLPPITYPPQK